MVTEEEQRRLDELRRMAHEEGGLYPQYALEYARLLGQKGLTKPKIMRAAQKGYIRKQRPTGAKWWLFDVDSLSEFYGETDERLDE